VVDTEDFAIGIAVHALPDAAVGKISSIEVPESDKIRSTFGFFEGDMVLPGDHLGEIVVQGNDRQNCIANAQEALAQVKIAGVEHDLAMSQRLFGLSEYRHAPLNRDQVAEQFSLD